MAHWWTQHGRRQYPDARRVLLLCDGVGSRLQSACVQGSAAATGPARLGLEIRVAHYPPYDSKHNPIEHRLFAPVTRACQGGVFHTFDIAKKFMAKTKTSTGSKVSVAVLDGVYAAGKKCAADFLATMRITFDEHLPQWSYRATPLDR
ncbi:ISAzo13-like element transposase-related protein [Polaromonas sp. SM01]|uniref:ISAzo13-like element transposase-related protein n=1 Tax=Polaromonas sp. SM01 TaxID=3085630 RepID=UPI0029824C85|nr:hypothetical protein [Polaromonas sp. SM01]MDW5442247.1 hypothetical protein [Polaromonas sp. SM01]